VWASCLGQRFWRRWRVLMLAVAMVVVLPRLATAILTNAGSLALTRAALLSERNGPGEPHARLLGRARAQFERAVTLDGDLAAGRWGLGRAALALVGLGVQEERNGIAAADALSPLAIGGTRNPLLYQDALIALSFSGQPEALIALYDANLPVGQIRPISDTVALAYMRRSAPGDLARARAWRPGDLYVNYHLWQAARDAGDVRAAAAYSRTLAYFPLEAVNPTDGRLLDYAVKVIPSLLDEGLWDRDKTLNTVSFLVWQHNGAVGVERLLEQLAERHPADPDRLFYLAELYHRRGDLDQAEAVYRQVQALGPAYAQAYLRLGMVAEAPSQISNLSSQAPSSRSQEQLKDAARWYGQYHAMVSDDLLDLKRLAEVCTALEQAGKDDESCRQAALRVSGFVSQVEGKPETSNLELESSPAATLLGALEVRTGDRYIVADLLGVPVEDVLLGPNLMKNEGFEEWLNRRPRWWGWVSWFSRGSLNAAAFAGGADDLNSFDGRWSARVDGLWVQRQEDKRPARAGFWQWDETARAPRPITLTVGIPYVLSFHYRTMRVPDGGAKVWVSDSPDVFRARHYSLPATGGAWYHFAAIGANRSSVEAAIRPIVRSYASGCVEFDDVQMRPIWLPAGSAVDVSKTWIWVTGQGD
jgi:tetratricopeptide (TPR) repeat protein